MLFSLCSTAASALLEAPFFSIMSKSASSKAANDEQVYAPQMSSGTVAASQISICRGLSVDYNLRALKAIVLPSCALDD
jgi:hypothetical protein